MKAEMNCMQPAMSASSMASGGTEAAGPDTLDNNIDKLPEVFKDHVENADNTKHITLDRPTTQSCVSVDIGNNTK